MSEQQEHAAMKAAIEWLLTEIALAAKRNAVTWPEPDGFGAREVRLERSLVERIFRNALQGIPPNEVTRVGLDDGSAASPDKEKAPPP